MSDREIRDLERRYQATGDQSVLSRLLSLRFKSDTSIENALALFEFIWLHTPFPIDLQSEYMSLLLPEDIEIVRNSLNHYQAATRLFIGPFSLADPSVTSLDFKGIQDARDSSVRVIRALEPDDDLDELMDTGRLLQEARNTARLLIQHGILNTRVSGFILALPNSLDTYISTIDLIRADRNILRQEFGRYLELLRDLSPLEAGQAWYQEKRRNYENRFKRDVLEPNSEVVFAQLPETDAEAYAPECFFPFYEYLTDETSDVPRINFLAALELNDIHLYHREEEFEVKEEEEERYADTLGISREEFLEGDYYDEYRQFERHFEEDLYPKYVKKKLQEEISEIEEEIVSRIREEDTVTVIQLLQGYEDGYVGHYEFFYESREQLDNELEADMESAVSLVVDEPYEDWVRQKPDSEPFCRVIPLDEHSKQRSYGRRNHVPSRSTPWYKLNTRPICNKPPMIKLDTRAIGWKAAFGVEPFIPAPKRYRYR